MRFALAIGALALLGGLAFGVFGASRAPEIASAHSSEEFLRRYDEEKERYLGLLATDGPEKTLATMRSEMAEDPFVSAYCHEIAHEIGRAAAPTFASFGDMLQFQDEICASGYLHGLMEGYFVHENSATSTTEHLGRECEALPHESYARGQCFHGVGHGLTFSLENDLPQAVGLCELYEGKDVEDCASGAYMENFNTDQQTHRSAYIRANDFFYPCGEQDGRHKSSCYVYAPLYFLNMHGNDFDAAIAWCGNAEAGFENSCYYGVGYQVARRNALDPKFSESVCNRAPHGGALPCVAGFIQMQIAINNLNSRDKLLQLCGQLGPLNRQFCEEYPDFSLPSTP